MNIENEIQKLMPNVCEDFITFPLWEEGDYRPTIKIWKLFKELPKGINNYSKFDLGIVGFENKDLFYVSCNCKIIGGELIEFLGEKLKKEMKIYVEFSISNATDIFESQAMNLEKLIEVANLINTYYK